jgi:hypothetical protein
MGNWWLAGAEPKLDKLLADEMMISVTRSAGTDVARLRALLRDMAHRLPAERLAAIRPRCASRASFDCRPSAA